jgi:flagellar biosynthesis/type III secretory pathway chaperone
MFTLGRRHELQNLYLIQGAFLDKVHQEIGDTTLRCVIVNLHNGGGDERDG